MPARPCRTITRFSSDSGTMSAIVARATRPSEPDQEVAQVRRGAFAVAEALADLPGQLERHARPAEVGAGVAAARRAAGGRSRRRPAAQEPIVWWSVTISSTPSSLASCGFAHRRDPAIDRDDQLGLVLGRKLAASASALTP